ncbi:pilus assembly protein TadG-related protein [Streptomyces sp. T-3]|nr:pilus assembly protein TadG-related protein [Streptomyces sp. T-3]
MTPRLRDDKGSTIPLYVWTVGMVLFAAFVFFVFAKGAVARSGAQSAADAAALAAAQEARDELRLELIATLPTGAWEPPLNADIPNLGVGSNAAAMQLAAENQSQLRGPVEQGFEGGNPTFTARVETDYTVGDSLVPNTEDTTAKAEATAVVEPRCHMVLNVPTKAVEFECEGSGLWVIDPQSLNGGALPSAKQLFKVYLVD